MSFYNGAVLTHTIEPTFHTNSRTEFRINKEGLYFTNWRLVDVGAKLNSVLVTKNFSLSNGNWPIKTMYLMDGSTELSRLVNKEWMGWINTLSKNVDTTNIKDLNGVFFGWTLKLKDDGVLPSPETTTNYPNSASRISNDEDETPHSYFELRKLLPFLKNMMFLHTSVFNNLRLVIEWDYKDYIINFGSPEPNPDIASYTNLIPKLVVDEVLDERMSDKMSKELLNKPVIWNEVEVEKMRLASVVNDADAEDKTQNFVFRSNGFQNKTLNRVLLQKRPAGVRDVLFGKSFSEKLWRENVNFRVNGKDLLPNGGVRNNTNYGVQLTTDSWGNYITTLTGNYTGLNDEGGLEAQLITNKTNYFGVVVGEKIDSLQLELQRSYNERLPEEKNGAYDLLLFGEVQKAIVKDPKLGYQIIYT